MIKDCYNEGYTSGFKDGCNFSKIINGSINEELIKKLIKDCDLFVQSDSAIKFADLLINAEQNRLLEIIDNEIKKEKESNTTLLSVFNQLSGSDNASSMMIENSKQQYNYQYMSNILLFIGIFIALGAIRIASASV